MPSFRATRALVLWVIAYQARFHADIIQISESLLQWALECQGTEKQIYTIGDG